MSKHQRLRALTRAVYIYLVEDSYSPAFDEAERRRTPQYRNSLEAAAIVAAACESTGREEFLMNVRLKVG